MAGEKAFKDVLDYVTNSNLNFLILQTPFSAQLSLKKSFVKRFNESSGENLNEVKDELVHDADETKLKELEKRLTIVNLANMKLKETIEEKSNLISDLEHKYKDLDTDLKAEKKKMKKERQKFEKKAIQESEPKVKLEINEDEEITVEISNVSINNKFASLANNDDIMDPSNTDFVNCKICDVASFNEASLADHVYRHHKETSNFATQSSTPKAISSFQQTETKDEEFVPYNCFYCNILISNKAYLTEHVKKCSDMLEERSAMMMLINAFKRPKVPCDICHQTFESATSVQIHKMCEHDSNFGF